jgi:hypothetical protein
MTSIRNLLPALLCAALVTTSAWSEEKDQELTIDQLPAAVKATLLKAANGAALSDIEKETEDGKVVYTAEIPGADKGTVIEFTVAENGDLIKQEAEKAGEDDKEDGDQEDDKDEH